VHGFADSWKDGLTQLGQVGALRRAVAASGLGYLGALGR
jgi:hypothetical protein